MTRRSKCRPETGLSVIDAVSCDDWYPLRAQLEPYPKFLSVASMASVDLPVLPFQRIQDGIRV